MRLAQLFVEITGKDSALWATVAGVKSRLGGAGAAAAASFSTHFNAALLALGGAGVATGAALFKSVSGASDLSEEISKVNVVFDKYASTVTGTADELAKAYGLPKKEILAAASNIGLVGKGSGYASDKAAQLGSDMAKLAADASSFYNVPLPIALEKIRAGLVGEAEPLRAFGVLLSEDAVKAEAYRLGLAKSGKELDNAMKTTARASLITRGLADATGDLERTQGGAANQSRKFWGQLQNLSDTIGTELLPAFTELLTASNQWLTDFGTGLQAADSPLAQLRVGLTDTILVAKNLGSVFQIAGLNIAIEITKIQGQWSALLAYLKANPAALGVVWGGQNAANPQQLIGDIVNNVAKKMLGGGIGAVKPEDFMPKEFKGADAFMNPNAANNPAVAALEQMRQALLDDIAKRREDELAVKKPGAAAKKAVDVGAAPKKGEKAEFSDLVGFAKQLQIGAFGKDDAAKRTADNTKEMNAGIKELNRNFKANQAMPAVAT